MSSGPIPGYLACEARGLGFDFVGTICKQMTFTLSCSFVMPNGVHSLAFYTELPYVMRMDQILDVQRNMRHACMSRRKELSRL